MTFRTRSIDVPATHSREIERMLRLALSRHVGLVASVHITLTNGTVHRVSRCRVRTLLRDGTCFGIEEGHANLREAANQVAWRLGRRIGRRSRPMPGPDLRTNRSLSPRLEQRNH